MSDNRLYNGSGESMDNLLTSNQYLYTTEKKTVTTDKRTKPPDYKP